MGHLHLPVKHNSDSIYLSARTLHCVGYLPGMVLVYFTKNAPTGFHLGNTQKAAQKNTSIVFSLW